MAWRRRVLAACAGPCLALGAAIGVGAPAAAQWTLCNETSFVVQVAIGFPDGSASATEGWTRIRPGACEIARAQPLTPGRHYLYAQASRAHRGGLREWSGDTALCVDTVDFAIAGDAPCEEVGFDTRSFIAGDVPEAAWTTELQEPDRYSRERAATAGLQRLLADTGYEVRSIDGYPGRRTVRAVQQFLRDNGFESEPPRDELIDQLETIAAARATETGLRLCNRTDQEVWTALARRRDDGWESRGWWPLSPAACATVIDEALDEPSYYVYASVREDGVDRPLALAEETFCLADTKFAILGRENCTNRGYLEGAFLTLSTDDQTAATLEFSDEDFVASRARGRLRR